MVDSALSFLHGLEKEDSERNVAILVCNDYEHIGAIEKMITSDTIQMPAIDDRINLQKVTMIHYDCKIDKFIEKDAYINGFEKNV